MSLHYDDLLIVTDLQYSPHYNHLVPLPPPPPPPPPRTTTLQFVAAVHEFQHSWHYSDLMPRLVSSSLHYSLSQFMSSSTANITLICCHSSWVPTQLTLQWFNATFGELQPTLQFVTVHEFQHSQHYIDLLSQFMSSNTADITVI